MLDKFIAPNVPDDIASLTKLVSDLTDNMAELALTGKDVMAALGGNVSLRELVDLTTKASTVNKAMADSMKTVQVTVKSLNSEMLTLNVSTKERASLLKLQQAAELAPADSIAKVRAEAALLRRELMLLDQVKQQQLATDIKIQLAEKDAYIKNKVDEYTAQKINIGNYPGYMAQMAKVKEEMEHLSATGQGNSEEMKTLTGTYQSFASALGGVGGELTFVTKGMTEVSFQMETMKAAGQQLTPEYRLLEEQFQQLAVRGAELKEQLAGVTLAIKEAGAAGERGAMAMEKVSETLKEIGKFALEFAGLQLGMEFLSGISEEFEKADKSARNLRNTLENANAANLFGEMTKQSEEFAEKVKYLDDYEVKDVFSQLITYGKLTEDQIKETLPVVIDFAAKQGVTVEESAKTLISSFEGNAKALKQYGINIKDAKDEMGKALPPAERYSYIMEQLKPRIEGAAAAFGSSWSGQVESFKKSIREIELSIADFFVKLSGIDEAQQKAAVSAKNEANEGQKLVDEYEELSKKVDQTADDKKKLADITTQLGTIFGNSVLSINEETGALQLNIEATKDLIKQKLLLANQRATEQAAKYNAAKEDAELAQKQIEIDKKRYEAVPGGAVNVNDGSFGAGTRFPGGSPGAAVLVDLQQKMAALEDAKNRIKKSLSELKDLGFSEDDVNKLFAPGEIKPRTGAEGGDKPDKDNAIALEKQLSDAMFEEYKMRKEKEAETSKNIYENKLNSYEMRLEALKSFNAQQNQIKLQAIIKEQGDQQFSNDHMTQKPKESDEDFATRQQTENQKLQNLQLKFDAQKLQNTKDNNAAIEKLNEDFEKKRLEVLQQIADVNAKYEGVELRNEKIRFEKGLESEDEYGKNVQKIKEKYATANLLMQKAQLDEMITEFRLLGLNTDDLEKKLQSIINQINNLPASKKDKSKDKPDNFNALAVSKVNDALGLGMDADQQKQAAQEIISSEKLIQDAVKQRYDAEMQALEKKQQLIDQTYDSEINAINGSFMSEQKKAMAVSILTKEKQQADLQIHNQELALKRKMAVDDKAANVAKAIGAEAVAVNTMLSAGPGIGFVLAAIAAAIGAGNVALALNTQLPQYGEGTEDHPGGPAILGDRFRRERIEEPGKAPYWSADKPTVYNLAKHTRVIPEEDLVGGSMAVLPDGSLHIINSRQDFSRLETATKEGFAELKEAVLNKKETHFHWNNGELRKSVKMGSAWTDFLDSSF